MDFNKILKAFFFILVGVLFLMIFKQIIESSLVNNEYLNWYYSIEASLKLDILVFLMIGVYSAISINNCKLEKPNLKVSYLFLLILCLYTFERFFNNYFEFLPLKMSSFSKHSFQIAYLDCVYWIALLHFSLYLKDLIPAKSLIAENQLLEDKPIDEKEEDGLDGLFEIPAEKILKIIGNNTFQNSLTIGLNGEWGSGKTSVFNLIRNRLDKEGSIITIDYNPWMGFDKKVLVKDFFNSLSEALGGSFSEELTVYSNEILDNSDTPSSIKVIQSIFFKRESSLESIFTSINKKIEALNKKIVVFVDDVDRLDKDEIFEILKLIRKTANFKHTFFVLAYDRIYVNNSIKDQSGNSVIKYLDKIINVEIGLPYYDKNILKTFFIKILRQILPADLEYKVDYFVKSYEKDPFVIDLGFKKDDLFLYWMSNFREIKKVVNAIQINYSEIYRQVNFVDVIYLEILKLKHPQLYSYLYSKRYELLAVNGNVDAYYLRQNGENRNSKILDGLINQHNTPTIKPNSAVSNAKIETILDIYLNIYVKENGISDIEKQKILDLIEMMFRRWEGDYWFSETVNDDEAELSVKFVNKFERYFSHTVFGINLTEEEFEEFTHSKTDNLQNLILKLIENGQLKDLCFRLNRKFSYDSEIEYVNTVKGSMLLLNNPQNTIDEQMLTSKMFGAEFLNIFSTKESPKLFFKNLFNSNADSGKLLTYAKMLVGLNERNRRRDENDTARFPLSENDINDILEQYAIAVVRSEDLFSPSFWHLYLMCQKLQVDKPKEAFESVNQLIIKKLDTLSAKLKFLQSLIIYDGYGWESRLRQEVILKLYYSFENFEEQMLNTLPDNDQDGYFVDFKKYYYESKSKDWTYIRYDYDFIKLSLSDD